MAREPYHILDPVFARTPFPWSERFETERVGGVQTLRMARLYGGHELMGVYCYAIGDTLVDTGLACYAPQMRQYVSENGIRRALVTHHHEDHAGNAATLRAAGVEVCSSGDCCALLRDDLPIRFYEHMAWGKMRPAEVSPLGARVALGPYEADVVPAPGHCHDQVVFHVASEGWLFSGDAFIHERVKIFRRDEDFAASLVTLAHLVTLDFDTLFCAHRPRFTGGKAALQQKLEWLRHLEGEVKRLHAQGLSVRETARRLDLVLSRPMARSFAWLTVGDATPENVVRSILHGPRQRAEVARHIGVR